LIEKEEQNKPKNVVTKIQLINVLTDMMMTTMSNMMKTELRMIMKKKKMMKMTEI